MKSLFFLLFLLFARVAFAQEAALPIPLPETGIKAAYLGALIYPGLKIGIERPFKVFQVDKVKSWGVKTLLKERYLTANLGYYHHPTYHDHLFVLVERQKRRQRASGWFTETAPGIGFSHTFLGEETYEVSNQGSVKKLNVAGHSYALLSFSAGLGYNLAVKGNEPLKVYGKASFLTTFPDNAFIGIRPTVEVGIVFTPKSFWAANPNLKHLTK